MDSPFSEREIKGKSGRGDLSGVRYEGDDAEL